jgi:hypothetical protein
MIELRGLSHLTFIKDWGTAERFLQWLDERASPEGSRQLSAPDLDSFLAWRMAGLRRATRSEQRGHRGHHAGDATLRSWPGSAASDG